MSGIANDNFLTIKTNEKNGCYIIDIAGEIIGNSAESLINIIEGTFLQTKSLELLLDLRKVTYINSYSFGIITYLWRIIKDSGRKFCILANSTINAKFDRFGLNTNLDLNILNHYNPSFEIQY